MNQAYLNLAFVRTNFNVGDRSWANGKLWSWVICGAWAEVNGLWVGVAR